MCVPESKSIHLFPGPAHIGRVLGIKTLKLGTAQVWLSTYSFLFI